MKSRNLTLLISSVLLITGIMVPSAMAADELPGIKKFNELAKEMNENINAANKEAREKEAQMAKLGKADELIPGVKKSKEQLEKAIEACEKNPSTEASEALQKELAAFAKTNADYVVLKSQELKLGIQLLGNLSDRFSHIINLFMEMEAIASDLDMTSKQEEKYLEMEKAVVGLSGMIDKIESFADPEDLANLRNTLEMQAKLRLQEDRITANLTEHLKEQAKTFSYLQAQTTLARNSLIHQKSLLSRIGLMKISENLLLKTSYMLVGGKIHISEFPKHFEAETQKSMNGMLEFAKTSTMDKTPKRKIASGAKSSYLAKTKERYYGRNK